MPFHSLCGLSKHSSGEVGSFRCADEKHQNIVFGSQQFLELFSIGNFFDGPLDVARATLFRVGNRRLKAQENIALNYSSRQSPYGKVNVPARDGVRHKIWKDNERKLVLTTMITIRHDVNIIKFLVENILKPI